MNVNFGLCLGVLSIALVATGCSPGTSAGPTHPSQTPTGSEGQRFPNDAQVTDTSVEQLDFVVAALTDYAAPTVAVQVGGREVQSYGQESSNDPAPYATDQTTIASAAATCIADQLAAAPTRPAVVMDIDETVLSNLWNFLEQPNLVANKDVRLEAAALSGDPAIEATRSLFDQVTQAGAAVVLISGRPESYRRATVRNLRRAQVTGYEQVILAPFRGEARSALECQRCRLRPQVARLWGNDDSVSSLGQIQGSLMGGATR